MNLIIDFSKCRLNSKIGGRRILHCPVCGKKGQRVLLTGLNVRFVHKVEGLIDTFLKITKCDVLLVANEMVRKEETNDA